MSAPYALRWRSKIMKDDTLTWKAKVAGVSLVCYANADGSNCFPGADRCAHDLGISRRFIQRGWDELTKRGYLRISPLPEAHRGKRGALKTFLFPGSGTSGDPQGDQEVTTSHENVTEGRSTSSGTLPDTGFLK